MITQSSTRAEAVGTQTGPAVHATGVHKSFSDSTGSKFRAVRELNLSIPRGRSWHSSARTAQARARRST